MGKGRIITDHGEGHYTIELVEDRARADAARAIAVERVAALDTRINELEVDLAEAQAEVDSAADTLDQAIAAYQAEVQADGDSDIDTTTPAVALQEAAAKRDAIAASIRALKVERLALQRRIDLIDALPPLRQQQAWCADYTEGLSGEVATAEVPGEVQAIQVRPGYNGGAVYDQARDGALQPALSGTPAGVFYNLAMMPGWQKWRPTYRVGTISAIDYAGDTCSVTLDTAESSQQGLNVNAKSSYDNVPIQYMSCDAAIFEDGDRVLVRFDHDPDTPTVIGFESNPKLCQIHVAIPLVLQVYRGSAEVALDVRDCNPAEPDGVVPNYTTQYRYRITHDGGRVYLGLTSSDYTGASHIDELGGNYVASSESTTIVEGALVTMPEYQHDYSVKDDEGICVDSGSTFEQSRVPYSGASLLGFTPSMVMNAPAVDLTIEAFESSTYGYYQHPDPSTDSIRYAVGEDAQSLIITNNHQHGLADLTNIMYSGQEYEPAEIVAAVGGDLRITSISGGNDYRETQWMLVRYQPVSA